MNKKFIQIGGVVLLLFLILTTVGWYRTMNWYKSTGLVKKDIQKLEKQILNLTKKVEERGEESKNEFQYVSRKLSNLREDIRLCPEKCAQTSMEELKNEERIPVKMEWIYIDGKWVQIEPTPVDEVLDPNGNVIGFKGEKNEEVD